MVALVEDEEALMKEQGSLALMFEVRAYLIKLFIELTSTRVEENEAIKTTYQR